MAINPVFLSGNPDFPLSQDSGYGLVGQYEIGSRWWVIAEVVASALANPTLQSYYSDNQGASWTLGGTGPTVGNNESSSSYPGTGTDIVVVYKSSGSSNSGNILLFDATGTGTFGSPIAVPYNMDTGGGALQEMVPLLLSGGDIAVVFQQFNGINDYDVAVAVYSGSWSSQLNVNVATTNKRLLGVVLDTDGNIGIWSNNFSSPFQNTYSLTDGTSILNENSMGNSRLQLGEGLNGPPFGLHDTDEDAVLFAMLRLTTGPSPDFNDNQTVSVIKGTPHNNPTSWTFTDVYSVDFQANPDLWLDFPYILKIGASSWSIFFGSGDTLGLFADGNYQILRTDSTDLTTWGAPSVIYDLHTNLWPQNPTNDNMEFMWVNQLSDGTIGIVVGMMQDFAPAQSWCGVLGFFSVEASATPLTIDLDVSLGISFSFGFSGGPPPPPPPPFCELVPAGASPELIIYNEPLERLGS